MEKWTNYGDANFMEYGGCLVKPHLTEEDRQAYPSLASQYDVFVLEPGIEEAEQGKALAALMTVDLDDTWYEWSSLAAYLGFKGKNREELEEELRKQDPAMLATELAGFYSWADFGASSCHKLYSCTREDFLADLDDIKEWMNAIGAGEFIAKAVA